MAAMTRFVQRVNKELSDEKFPGGLAQRRKELRDAAGGASAEWWSLQPGIEPHHFTEGFRVEILGPDTYDVNPTGADEARPSPYKGAWFRIQIKLEPSYPATAPSIHFDTRLWHPAVGDDGGDVGKVCAEFVSDMWKADSSTLFDLISAIRAMLAAPDAGSGANSAAQAMISSKKWDEFDAKAREYVARFNPVEDGDGDDDDDDDDDDE